jgi:hypothetical protein
MLHRGRVDFLSKWQHHLISYRLQSDSEMESNFDSGSIIPATPPKASVAKADGMLGTENSWRLT